MKLLIFDMDGVLVDPTESYRGALIDTVEHFAGVRPEHDEIVAIKNEGGYNDNTLVAERILRRLGSDLPYDEMRRYFRLCCWGANGDGSTPEARMRAQSRSEAKPFATIAASEMGSSCWPYSALVEGVINGWGKASSRRIPGGSDRPYAPTSPFS